MKEIYYKNNTTDYTITITLMISIIENFYQIYRH